MWSSINNLHISTHFDNTHTHTHIYIYILKSTIKVVYQKEKKKNQSCSSQNLCYVIKNGLMG